MKAGTDKLSFIRILAAAALIAAPVAACGSHPPRSSSPPTAATLVKATLSYRPSGTAALSWDPQSKNITAKLQMAGFTPGSIHAIHINQGGCAAMGDVVVPFPDVTADGAGAINTSVTSDQLVPGGLLPGTALNMHLAAGSQLGGPGQLGYTPIACADITAAVATATLTMAPMGPRPQGSANLTYDPGNKTLTVATSASGLAPGSAHAQDIGLGTCEAQGASKYPLNDLVALASGTAYQTTVIQNVDQAPPPSGWYLNVHLGSAAQVLENGQPTLYFQPIICGNIGK
ncbi:MAG: CHRD domain-containing protein [Mycobacteriaceae bacterium]|nr:CHRD domain-containing protein [Mycobacteriaceae bacterium]